jgi:hypothetical protein
VLTTRRAAASLDELLVGATERVPWRTTDGKSGSSLEQVVIDGERFVVKVLHVDDDWTMRGMGDVACRPLLLWTSGLLDRVPDCIDHATVGAAAGLGRNGWGGALLLRDVGPWLVPPGDEVLSFEQHRGFLDHLGQLSAAFWDWDDDIGLVPMENRWSAFGPDWLAAEAALGWPEPVPLIAAEGWTRFDERAPDDVVDIVQSLRHDLDPLVVAARSTPWTFLHGDWKLGNVGSGPDGRTVLLDWTYPGAGPVGHDLAWYLALNRARLPESKEDSIVALRESLETHGVATNGWWEPQIELCLLGALVQFGWEKALGDDEELGWWCDQARVGAERL